MDTCRYSAFISYSHADARWAAWLQRRLEGYRLPRRLRGTPGARGRHGDRLAPCFRDRSDLAAVGDLDAGIRAALAEASALLVVCSPAAAASRWVEQEVAAFRALGRRGRIFCLIVAGTPEDGGCFPPSLRSAPEIPVAADVRPGKDGRALARLKLVAGLLDLGLDDLRRREAQRSLRRMAAVAAASVLGMGLTLGLAATAWLARDDAQRRQAQAEDLLGFLHGDLRQKLEQVGRLDLLDTVGDKSTAYFASLDPRDLSDNLLQQQIEALTQLGVVRIEKGDHPQARAAFEQALDRARELAQRDPDDAPRRYLQGQAEMRLGEVAWRQGDYAQAATWLGAYLDSTRALVALEPASFAWQREYVDARHNLAVLAESQGRYDEAEQAFLDIHGRYQAWYADHPDDAQLRHDGAKVASFLGTLCERQGRLAEAERWFAEDVRALRDIHAREPQDARWQSSLASELVLLAEVQGQIGHREAARAALTESTAINDALVARDPENLEWRKALAYSLWWQATLLREEDPQAARAAAAQAEQILDAANRDASRDQYSARWLASARLLLARLAVDAGDGESARAWLRRCSELVDASAPGDDALLARIRLLEADLALAADDAPAARRAWAEAERHARRAAGDPPAFESLDLLVRSLLLQGKHDDALPHLARLERAGYQPLSPWPRALPPATDAASTGGTHHARSDTGSLARD